MKIEEMRQLTTKKLWTLVRDLHRQLSVKKFHIRTGQDKKNSEISVLKKSIARAYTLLNDKKNI